MELLGRRALITGGGRGIGRHLALRFAREGARLALTARSQVALEETAEAIKKNGGECIVAVADVTDAAQMENVVESVRQAWDGLDILVNNAGVQGPIGLSHEVDVAAWIRTVETNLIGTFLCTRLVLPLMIKARYGKIINLSGGGAVSPRPRFSAYSAAKAGVVRFTETLAAEVGELGIDVNAVAPGAINTGMLDEVFAAGPAAGKQALAEAQQQRQSGGGDPDRPAALGVYLASARSDGLSGRLFSAVWDHWEEIDIAAVMASEAYTVRRLVPED